MKKPNPKAYGQDNELWEKGGKEAYEKAYLKWAEYRTKYGSQSGRVRLRPIHPSWESILQYFDSTNPKLSQGAFCRYVNQEPATKGYWKNGLTPAMLSAAKTKQITNQMYAWIHRWAYDSRKEVENG